jgi:hypothetical protein
MQGFETKNNYIDLINKTIHFIAYLQGFETNFCINTAYWWYYLVTEIFFLNNTEKLLL